MIVSSNAKFVIKSLLSHLSQQHALPLISLAIDFVNDEDRDLGSKVINFWNSVGDMLNKKFKGKLKRNGNFVRKGAELKQKTDKPNESTDHKSAFSQQETYIAINKERESRGHTQLNYVNPTNLMQMPNSFQLHDLRNKAGMMVNYKPAPLSGVQVISNYQNVNLMYSTAPNPIFLRFPQAQVKPMYGCQYVPFRQNEANYFYIPMNQN